MTIEKNDLFLWMDENAYFAVKRAARVVMSASPVREAKWAPLAKHKALESSNVKFITPAGRGTYVKMYLLSLPVTENIYICKQYSICFEHLRLTCNILKIDTKMHNIIVGNFAKR